jgi:hypothetical protein
MWHLQLILHGVIASDLAAGLNLVIRSRFPIKHSRSVIEIYLPGSARNLAQVGTMAT